MGSRLWLRPPQPRLPIAALTTTDHRYLEETLRLARQARGIVEPDPLVGSLVVDPATDTVIGRGHHARHGGPHAEPVALDGAGSQARGATLYCNLEPCGYDAPGKRHPPCTAAIIRAGVARVVVGQIDPHPRVRGSGIERLRGSGIEVDLSPDPRPYWVVNADYTTRHALARAFDPATDLVEGRPSDAWLAALEAERTLRP